MLLLQKGHMFGTYVHGIFDRGKLAYCLMKALAEKKGITLEAGSSDYQILKEAEYDKLAEMVRKHLDMEFIYGLLQ